ncbi:MAG: UvrD-helicase domain-containing protein [Deltaproteobacteria bacterium]|nr:UvrD-helicase domain-containing protein [Nannocystaceae bacterium]
MSLNPEQSAAVAHRGSPLLVLAGAGTGKTRVITHRVAALLDEGTEPWRILAVTFTNKAAQEMRARIDRLCEGRHDTSQIWVGTFHSICARILRRFGTGIGLSPRFTIYDTSDSQQLMGRVLDEQNVSDKLFTPRGVLGWIDRAKNRGAGPEGLDDIGLVEPVRSVVRKAFVAYQKRLLAADAVDFGDLLVHAVTLLRAAAKPSSGQLADTDPARVLLYRFQHVVVDEFQDTNPIQAELVDRLSTRAELCVVGDDDQAIYGWRGADVDQILSFANHHESTNVVRLEHNYRSTGHILHCADAVIRKNAGRLGKSLWTDAGDGERVRVLRLVDERAEAKLVAHEIRIAIDDGASPEEFAIFYRTHAQSRAIEDALRTAGLSVRIIGGLAFYERTEVKDVLAYLVVLDNPASEAHLVRAINRPARGIGNTTVQKLLALASLRSISLWDALADARAAGLSPAAAKKVAGFVMLIEELRALVPKVTLDALVVEIVERTGYREMLAVDGDEESLMRLENLQELLGNVQEFVADRPAATLADYLELTSLVAGERAEGDKSRAVTMMTVHSAKGLEYDTVYLTGMEERIFPHSRVLEDPVQMEEERRLAYVAITRARKHLTMTLVERRRIYGQLQVGVTSRFVLDLPIDSVESAGQRPRASAVSAPPPRKASWNQDVVYDDPDVALDGDEIANTVSAEVGEGVALFVGMHVKHQQFGVGELLGWQGTGMNMKFTLRFSGAGTKTILARFCQMV